MHISQLPQRIDAQLSAVDVALEFLRVRRSPVAERFMDINACAGFYLSRDILAPFFLPDVDVAAIDGCALASADLIGASSFNPAFLMVAPVSVCVGEPVPDGCDCVVDFGCVGMDGPPFTIDVAASPGDGIRRIGADAKAGSVLMRAGSQLRPFHMFLLQSACVTQACVRAPRVRILNVPCTQGHAQTFSLVSALGVYDGVVLEQAFCASRSVGDIADDIVAHSFGDGAPDLLITIGGSGSGANDHSVEALRCTGAQVLHGLALSGASTIAVGSLNGLPVISLPGRFEAALAGWLALVAPVLQTLCGARQTAPLESGRLLRKVSSTPGMSEIVLLERNVLGWAPSSAGDMTFAHALLADGYLLLDAGSEGLAEGSVVRPLPLPAHWSAGT